MKTKLVKWIKKNEIKGTAQWMQTAIEIPDFFQGIYDGRPVEFSGDAEVIQKYLPSAFDDQEVDTVPDTEPQYPEVHVTYLDIEVLIAEGSERGGVEMDAVPLNKVQDIVQL